MKPIILIPIMTLLFAFADAFVFRAKVDPIVIWEFNLFLEVSKICYIGMVVSCILLGRVWRKNLIAPILFMLFIAKSIPFNLVAGLQWDYIGIGIFDTAIKVITGVNVYVWISLQIILLVLSILMITERLFSERGNLSPLPYFVAWYSDKFPKWYLTGIMIICVIWGIINTANGKSSLIPTIILNVFLIPTVIFTFIAFLKKRRWENENNL